MWRLCGHNQDKYKHNLLPWQHLRIAGRTARNAFFCNGYPRNWQILIACFSVSSELVTGPTATECIWLVHYFWLYSKVVSLGYQLATRGHVAPIWSLVFGSSQKGMASKWMTYCLEIDSKPTIPSLLDYVWAWQKSGLMQKLAVSKISQMLIDTAGSDLAVFQPTTYELGKSQG